MAMVFGVDVQALLDLEPSSETSSGLSTFTNSSKDADERGEGTLFGSLVNRAVEKQSMLYKDATFGVSLPELQNEPPELFDPVVNKEFDNIPIRADNFGGLCSDSGSLPHAKSLPNEADGRYTRSPYLLEAGREEVTKAMYSLRWREIAFRESYMIDLTLMAMQGTESDFYGRRALAGYLLPGYSSSTVHKYMLMFTSTFFMRRVLDFAVDKYSSMPYPALQAFGLGLSELLELHDATVVSLRTDYTARERHAASVGVKQSAQSPLALSDLWRVTQPQRNLLWLLFCTVAEEGLKRDLTRYIDNVGTMNEGALPGAASENITSTQLAALLPLVEPHSTLLSEKRLVGFLDGDCSWFLMEHLVERLQTCRTLLHGLHRESVLESTGSCYFYSASCLSDSFVNLVVISVLLRKVSAPLLDHVQKVVFRLELGLESGLVQEEELKSTLSISPESLGGASSVSAYLVMASLWAQSRVALLSGYVEAESITSQLLERYYKSPNEIVLHEPVKTHASEVVPKCVEPEADLHLPLRSSDLMALASSKRRARSRLRVVQLELDATIRRWCERSRHELNEEMREKVREWTEQSAGLSTQRVREAYLAKADIDELNRNLPEAPEERVRDEKSIEKRTPVKDEGEDALEGLVRSPLGIVKTLDKDLMEEARQALLQKYKDLGVEVEAREGGFRWRAERISTVPQSRKRLQALMQNDMQEWADGLDESLEREKKLQLDQRPAPIAGTEAREGAPSSPDRSLDASKHTVRLAVRESVKGILDTVLEEAVSLVKEDKVEVQVPEAVVHVRQEPGGTSTMRLSVEAPEREATSVRVQQAPGGTSQIDLASGSEPHEPVFFTRVNQAPGGSSQLSLQHDVPSEGKEKQEIVVAYTAEVEEEKEEQEIVALDTAEAEEKKGKEEKDEAPVLQPPAPFAPPPEPSLKPSDPEPASTLTSEPMSPPSPAQALKALTHPDPMRFEMEDSLLRATGSFSRAVKLLAEEHGIFLGEGAGEDDLDMPLLLQPWKELCHSSLQDAIQCQCRVLDQATLYTAIESKGLLDSVDLIDDVLMWSDSGDFLSTLSTSIVEVYLDRNGARGVRSNPQPEFLWSSACLRGGFSRAREQCVLKNKHLLDRVTFDFDFDFDFSSHSHERQGTEDYSVFSIDNLQHLVVSYDALWPVSAFYSPSELRLLSTTTRRLLEIGHSAVLVRMVQCDLRSLKVEAERDNGVRSDHFSPAVMRKAYDAFRLVQGSVQSASSFGSNRLRVLQGRLRQDIVKGSGSGCAGMFALIRAYNRSVVSSLFIASDEAGSDDPACCIVGLLLQELLSTARNTLKALSMLADKDRGEGLLRSLDKLDSALKSHNNIKDALVEAAKQLVKASDNENAKTLLLYFL